jgi:hypothetical protein
MAQILPDRYTLKLQQQRKADQQVRKQTLYGKKADPERLALIAAANAVARVRVLPKNELIRKYLKHEPTKIAFRPEGSIEWPLDNFTMRRLRDGDVTIETQDVEMQTAPQQRSSRARSE